MNEKQDIENNSNIKKIRTDNKTKESTTTSSKAKTSSKKLFKKIQKILILQRTGRKISDNKIKEIFITEKENRVKYQQAHLFQKIFTRWKTPRISAQNIDNGILGYYEDIDDKNYRVLKIFISVSFLGAVFIINIKQAQI